jgi:hypothetical protein
MNPEEKSTGSGKALGIAAGIAAMFINGLILYPVVYKIFLQVF